MKLQAILPVLLANIAIGAPEQHEKRQDYSQLLDLASEAGITALPTDPAVLLSLGPIANSLAAALPTASVISVLQTAAPSGFISSILHDPSYAQSFESQFSAGTPPGWFQSLPTDVKSYLHTYSNYGNVATGLAAVNSLTAQIGMNATGSGSSGSGSSTSGGSGSTTMTTSSSSQSGGGVTAGSSSSSSSGTGPSGAAASPTSSQGQAPKATAAVAMGLMGVAGVLGLAIAL
ncbi:hypothetical protein MMC09_001336 [Bachmanniomyces sp. S44760]|nr:hypothetical protein [Bachmanniomyces sp. S44760]